MLFGQSARANQAAFSLLELRGVVLEKGFLARLSAVRTGRHLVASTGEGKPAALRSLLVRVPVAVVQDVLLYAAVDVCAELVCLEHRRVTRVNGLTRHNCARESTLQLVVVDHLLSLV